MTEIWLKPNRRVLLISFAPAALLAGLGALLLGVTHGWLPRALGWSAIALATVLAVGLLSQLRQPRIAYRNGSVLFHLRSGRPIAVPAQVVEAFFLGQGPAHLPALSENAAETVNLVARLSQKAPEWSRQEVKHALGNWCEGYVTLRGTWCEPLDNEVVRRLNRRLREVHDGLDSAKAERPAATASSEHSR